jgi:hypothetical protein
MKCYVLRLLMPLVVLLAAGGCTSVERSFDGYGSDQVWTAMVATAESPAYADWKVAANDVWVDESEQRIEIFRHLRRVLYRPGADPHHETQTWRFEVRLEGHNPPTATFVSRGVGLPTSAQFEADRFFLDVHDLLMGVPAEAAMLDADEAVLDSFGADERPLATDEVDDIDGVEAVEFHGPD